MYSSTPTLVIKIILKNDTHPLKTPKKSAFVVVFLIGLTILWMLFEWNPPWIFFIIYNEWEYGILLSCTHSKFN